MNLTNKKLKHLKSLGFKNEELIEIEKLYNGEFFDPLDKGYRKLVKLSYYLCAKYNSLFYSVGKNVNVFKRLKNYFKKRKIIKTLFPISNGIADVGENVKVVIGQVDFLGKGFLNRAVEFSKYSLVCCKNYTIFGIKIKVGDNNYETKDGLIKLGRVTIENDCWICGGVKICNNIHIGKNCVVGAGAIVTKSLTENKLCLGRPCEERHLINKTVKSKKENVVVRTDVEIQKVLKHFKANGYKGRKKIVEKYLNGEPFNSVNISLGLTYLYTHRLCAELNNENTGNERREEILNILFPNHGKNLSIGKDFYVDLLGTTIIGDNVTIKDSVYLGGNIKIGNNVVIEDNSLLFASGHSLNAKDRHVSFRLTHGLYNITIAESICVEDNVTVGKNCVIVPGLKVLENVENDKLVIKNKVV